MTPHQRFHEVIRRRAQLDGATVHTADADAYAIRDWNVNLSELLNELVEAAERWGVGRAAQVARSARTEPSVPGVEVDDRLVQSWPPWKMDLERIADRVEKLERWQSSVVFAPPKPPSMVQCAQCFGRGRVPGAAIGGFVSCPGCKGAGVHRV